MSQSSVISNRQTEEVLRAWAKKHEGCRVRGVCTSFGLDAPVWERILERSFGRIPCHIALVDKDSAQVTPQNWAMNVVLRHSDASFHPKAMLWWAEKKTAKGSEVVSVLAGLGSANLTSGGVGGHNRELMFFDDAKPQEASSLMLGVIGFLDDLLTSEDVMVPREAKGWRKRVVRIQEICGSKKKPIRADGKFCLR